MVPTSQSPHGKRIKGRFLLKSIGAFWSFYEKSLPWRNNEFIPAFATTERPVSFQNLNPRIRLSKYGSLRFKKENRKSWVWVMGDPESSLFYELIEMRRLIGSDQDKWGLITLTRPDPTWTRVPYRWPGMPDIDWLSWTTWSPIDGAQWGPQASSKFLPLFYHVRCPTESETKKKKKNYPPPSTAQMSTSCHQN